jgi:hypothetical protein
MSNKFFAMNIKRQATEQLRTTYEVGLPYKVVSFWFFHTSTSIEQRPLTKAIWTEINITLLHLYLEPSGNKNYLFYEYLLDTEKCQGRT